MSINLNSYPILNQYVIVGQSGITSAATLTIVGGNYGNSGGPGQITGTIVGGTLDQADIVTATSQLGTLKTDINNLVSGFSTHTNIGTTPAGMTFNSGIDYFSATSITFTGALTLVFDAQGDPNAQFFITARSGTITFTTVAFSLINGANAQNIFWNASVTISSAGPTTAVPGILMSGSAAITFAGVTTINGRAYSPGTNVTFAANTTINYATQPVPCYLKGSLVLTESGYVPIENLKVDDRVLTKGRIYNGNYIPNKRFVSRTIKWLDSFKPSNLNKDSLPICIEKDALGINYPNKDLYVSPDHGIIFGNKFVSAKDLINDKTIYQDTECQDIEYYHLELDIHSLIIVNGILGESYLDDNNRYIFDNKISELDYKTEIAVEL